MADVLLTHSYHLPYDAKQLRKMQPYPPLGTLYAAAALLGHQVSVAVFDSMLESPESNFAATLREHRPKIVAVYEDDFNFLSKMCLSRMREVAWAIAAEAKKENAVVVVHGSDSADNPRTFLEHGFDYVLCGEAEETLAQLCCAVLRGSEPPPLDGLVRLDRDGSLVRTAKALSKNPVWTSLAYPRRELVDLEPYRAQWMKAHGYFSTNMVSSRGCPYRCNWCAKPISGNKFQLRPAADVAEEMRMLKVHYGVQHIWFGDDVFALNRNWVEEFVDEVTRRNAAVPFKIQSRADLMTEQTVSGLKAAGCVEVWMGVESGSQTVLDAMDKGLRLSSVHSAREWLRRFGVRACYFLQFGYPGETWVELQQTIALVRETRPDDIGISFSYPLPGTAFYEKVRAQLGAKRNWADSDDLCIIFNAAYTTDFYRAVRDALHAEVDSWREETGTVQSTTRLAELWRKVDELEELSRRPDAFVPHDGISLLPSSAILPVPPMTRATEA